MELCSSSSTKRARGGNQVGVSCLVDGCKSDLSKCRDYHRRHKVCEVHSKTGRVSIGGREQRFCQQCSRFHSLGEFDEGKRSCRKRLEGHNRRRRKPQPQPQPEPSNPCSTGGIYLTFGSQMGWGAPGGSVKAEVVDAAAEAAAAAAAMYSQPQQRHPQQQQQQRRFPFLAPPTSSSSSGGLDRALSLLSSSPSLISSSGLHYNNNNHHCNCNISAGVGIQGSELLPPNSATIHHCQDVSFHAAAAASSSSSHSQQTHSFLWE